MKLALLLLLLAAPAFASPSCRSAPEQLEFWEPVEARVPCRVVATGRVQGLSWQLQAYGRHPSAVRTDGVLEVGGPPGDGAGIVLWQGDPAGRPRRLGAWSGTEAVLSPPHLVRTPAGPLLVVPASADVSAAPTDDRVFVRRNGRWEPVDASRWQDAIPVPDGTAQRRGSAMDWPTLRAYGSFARPDDPNCCGSGGSYVAHLALRGTTLVVRSVETSAGDLPFP